MIGGRRTHPGGGATAAPAGGRTRRAPDARRLHTPARSATTAEMEEPEPPPSSATSRSTPEPPADLAFGAFSDRGPWVVDLTKLPWRADTVRLREAARAEVPVLTQKRRMPPLRRFLEAGSAGRRGAARLAAARVPAAGRRGVARRPLAPAAPGVRAARTGVHQARPDRVVGQGIFPDELVEEFKRCRDQVPPEPFAVVRQVVEEDLGRPLDERVRVASTEQCLAAASIAQVHAATLRTGEEVVVKVQRPRVAQSGAARHRGDGVDRAASWSGASRSPRSPIRRRWSSCSPRPSSRSSTSASRRENMLDIARVLREAGQTIDRRAAPAPRAGHATRAGDGAAARLQVRRRRGHARRGHRHRGGAALDADLASSRAR